MTDSIISFRYGLQVSAQKFQQNTFRLVGSSLAIKSLAVSGQITRWLGEDLENSQWAIACCRLNWLNPSLILTFYPCAVYSYPGK